MMVTARAKYGIDFTVDLQTKDIIAEIETITDSKIEIDFTGCVLDYPATSKIIDAAIRTLERNDRPRILIVTFNFAFPERMFFKWFFFGGGLLARNQENADTESQRNIIAQALAERHVRFVIRIVNANGAKDLYKYE